MENSRLDLLKLYPSAVVTCALNPMLKIALFGTSADPPTTGHQTILAWLADRFDLVAVWASDNPFKSHPTSLQHRIAMLQLLIDAIQPPRHNLRLYPQLSHSRAIHTVEAANMIWREAAFTLVVGADLVPQFSQWYRIDELLQQVNLLVVPRPGYCLSEGALTELQQQGVEVAIADLRAPATSSTDYRNHHNPDALTPPIEAYIHQEHLYAWQDDLREKQPTR